MREEIVSLRLEPKVDHRFDGSSKEVVDHDQPRHEQISSLIRQVLQSPKKQELVPELSPEEGRKFTPVSDQASKVIKEQGNVEALEHLDLTDKIKCTH